MPRGSDAFLYVFLPESPLIDFGIATPAAIVGNAGWTKTCPVNVSYTGGTEEADTSDRCNPDAITIAKLTHEITFNFFKKRIAGNLLPPWAYALRNGYLARTDISLLMLDGPRTMVGADGYWMHASITAFSEDQQLTSEIEISMTVKPSGNTTFQNFGAVTVPA
jgi:hypothetical protein